MLSSAKQTLLSYTCSMEIGSRQFVYIAERLRTYNTRNSVRHATKQETRPTRLVPCREAVVYANNLRSLLRLSRKEAQTRRVTKNTSTFWRSVAQGSPERGVCRRSISEGSCVICLTIGPRKKNRIKVDDQIRECLSSRPINCVTNLEGESYVWEVCETSFFR